MAFPEHVQAAIDTLADYAVVLDRERAEALRREPFDDPEKLRAFVAGAVEVQVTDPDYEQAREVEFAEVEA